MKKINTITLLRIANIIWALVVILNFIFKFFDEMKTQNTIIIWMMVLLASIIYEKLDEIDKYL